MTLSAARQLRDRVGADIQAGTLAQVYTFGLTPNGAVELSFTDDATAGVDENAFVASLQERYGPGLEVKLHVPYEVAQAAVDRVPPPLPVAPGADG